MPNDNGYKISGIPVVGKIFRFIRGCGGKHLHHYKGTYREITTTLKLNSYDQKQNVTNALKEAAARTQLARLYDFSVSVVKHCVRYLQEQGRYLLKLISGPVAKKLTPLPVAIPIKVQRRTTPRKI